jgi:L-seryl-tRNA(Ser) seleniumtransferase
MNRPPKDSAIWLDYTSLMGPTPAGRSKPEDHPAPPCQSTPRGVAESSIHYNAGRMTLSSLPSVDRVLRSDQAQALIRERGRALVTDSIRQVLAEIRAERRTGGAAGEIATDRLLDRVRHRIEAHLRPSLRPVFNLTGTILHTNLGRAPLPQDAIDAIVAAGLRPTNLEFDLERGRRGDRDDHLEGLLCRLTGAEAATVVNNNAAAVLLVLNTLALRKEVPTSRGELIEIGGSFRLPEIMAQAGCRLREVGTTNRVHLRDYAQAIGPKTGLVMKVHTSNYTIAGFTASVTEKDVAALCRERGVPLAVDLGSGTVVDLKEFGLPHEPTPAESLRSGADLVTFSGDKLLGGPQAGIIVGRSDLIKQLKGNPLKRALRVDKLTIAALGSVLSLYLDPDTLATRLPVLRLLTRPLADVHAVAERILPFLAAAVEGLARVNIVSCTSEVGSGALPTREIASVGVSLVPRARRGSGTALNVIAAAFRALPVPVIGRIQEGELILDLRGLDDEPAFVEQLAHLRWAEAE